MCLVAPVPLAVPWQGGTAAILHPGHRERRERARRGCAGGKLPF